ncbi:MAG: YdcF family protein [Deltaproteobacteria bacterium]|nr:YdcF family protein [Deltaproteobacteria bacterium]
MQPRIIREGDDDPAWAQALDVTLSHFETLIDEAKPEEVRVFPVLDSGGERLPYLVDIRYGEQLQRVLVSDGKVVSGRRGGVAAAEAYLAHIGFPKQRISREFLAVVLGYHRAVDRRWLPYPIWEWQELDQYFAVTGTGPPVLSYEEDGSARLVIQRRVHLDPRVTEDRELEVYISPEGKIELRWFVGFGDSRTPSGPSDL